VDEDRRLKVGPLSAGAEPVSDTLIYEESTHSAPRSEARGMLRVDPFD